jgi:hypothetical protein
LELRREGSPYHHGGPNRSTFTQQLQQISHHRESKESNVQTPNDGMIRNSNLDFNAIRLQTIMVSIQRMAHEGSPLVALARQRAEAVNYVTAQRSTGNPRGESFIGNRSNDRAKRARSEAASSTSGNHHLTDNDVHRRIT